MKKILSTLLVASMLLSMIPAFAVSAADEESEPDVFDNAATEGYVEDDDGFATIDDELEFVEFARVANENGWGYMQTETIKITKDLDMSKLPEGVTYSPIQDGLFILDFGGNTVSNLHVTVTDVDSGNYGIIANQLTNAYPDFSAGIINLNLVDSSLTVDVVDGSAVNVGGLIGNANRAFVDNVNLTNVSITTDACDNVGGLVGNKSWSNCSNVSTNEAYSTIDATLNNVTINAPQANTLGTIAGWVSGDATLALGEVTTNVTVNGPSSVTLPGIAGAAGDGTITGTASGTVAFGDTATSLATIDTPAELLQLAELANGGVGNYRKNEVVKITKDLDMSGVTYTPIKSLNFTLDLGGNTISNLNVSLDTDDLYNNWHTNSVGTLAHYLSGNGKITNGTLKDSSIAVDVNGEHVEIGGVAGMSDRGYVSGVNLDNFTIISDSTGYVGGLMGCLLWSTNSTDKTISGNIDMDVYAPGASVGVLIGHIQDGGAEVDIANVTATVEVSGSSNAPTATTYFANGAPDATKSSVDAATTNITVDAADSSGTILATIDTPAELALLAEIANEVGQYYRSGETILVTADLDMRCTNYVPYRDARFVLDFDGHTVSNLVVNTDTTYAGLIAESLSNGAGILDIKLKNCSLYDRAASGYAHMGIVAGYANRGYVTSAVIEDVTVTLSGSGIIGGVIGVKEFDCFQSETGMAVTMNNVVINATEDGAVGLVAARNGGGSIINITKLDVTNLTLNVASTVAADTYVGQPNDTVIGLAEGVVPTVEFTTTATGYTAPANAGQHAELVLVPGTAIAATATTAGYTGDYRCPVCGEVFEGEEIAPLFNLYGANMNLGNSLDMNFFINMTDITAGTEYYVKITKTYADGRDDVVLTIDSSDWLAYGSYYYYVTFAGISAKEMNDDITVQVFYSETDMAASTVWTDSVRAYVERMLPRSTNTVDSTLYVNMLNYGAAAQEFFKYGADDLANAGIDAYQNYAIASVAYENEQVKGNGFVGSSLVLQNTLILAFAFDNTMVGSDDYAIVTFTDHRGVEKEVRIEGSEFVAYSAANVNFVYVDAQRAADARQLITCTVYDSNGTVITSASDSIESYVARNAATQPFYLSILKFSDAAYAYLHK